MPNTERERERGREERGDNARIGVVGSEAELCAHCHNHDYYANCSPSVPV